MKYFLLSVLLLLVLHSGWTQSAYRFRNYTISDGLSQSSVTSIIQDDNHTLWVGTQDGLNRFDGKSFEVFMSDETPGLQNEYIKSSLKTSDGRLWFGTMNGLTVYDPETERFYTFNLPGKAVLQIEDLCLDHRGTIWIATTASGLYSFSRKTHRFKSFQQQITSRKLKTILCARDGSLFIGTDDRGIVRFNPENNTSEQINLPEKKGMKPVPSCIVQWENDRILIGTNLGIYAWNFQEKQIMPVFPELDQKYGLLHISDIVRSDDQSWLISTSGKGLYTILPDHTIFNSSEDIFQKNALLYNAINLLFQDESGNFWVGSERGLSCFDPRNKGFLGIGPSGNPEKGIPATSVWSFAEDAAGKFVFIGTDAGVSRFDRKNGQFEQFFRNGTTEQNSGSAETTVLALHTISNQHLLVGCADGLFELSMEPSGKYQFNRVQFNDGFSINSRVYSILHYRGNSYFLGTKEGVVLIDLQKHSGKLFEYNPKKKQNTITAGSCRLIFRDLKNRIYFATSSGELSLLTQQNGELMIRPYVHNNMLQNKFKDYITSVYQVRPGEFWFGTFGAGLVYWNEQTGKIRIFSKKQGLPNNVVYSVLPDSKNNLWMSTNKGLSCFNLQLGTFRNYTETDGLMSNEFNLGASMRTQKGELYFGGIAGYNFFFPEKLDGQDKRVDVTITKFKLDKGWLKPNEAGSPLKAPIFKVHELKLTYRQRSFTLHFQPSDLSSPERISYKYILEGSNEGEINLGNTNEIHFNALSPGSYQLKIYARIGEGNWGKPAVLSIHILAPFWLSWWFWLLFLAFGGLVFLFILRKRIDKERREQVRLEMKIAERTREIREQNIKIEQQRKQLEIEKNTVEKQQRMLQIEKDKTEKLLKNVIPESTAEELKKGEVRARSYKVVSVLFTDFVGFTKKADNMEPDELVKKLDVFFRKFDEIIVRNNLEKIKTIGDAYMCAGGVPVRNTTNPIDICLAALQIQDYMRQQKNEAIIRHEDYWELRLGINTGEVTAGVIGRERLAFDVWGKTVNHAQRMERMGEPGKVTVTGNTYKHIEPYFECVFRGKVQSKSRGLIEMYTVERIKPELSINGEGLVPNERFNQIVNLHHYSSINYYKAERHILKLLGDELSPKLHYHSIEHTKDVVKAVERIALSEDVTDEGLFLLKSAASYHDAGFVEQYEKNEPIGARMATEILPKYGYTEQHIERIRELIFVTQIPHNPQNLLEEIICDADLDYLGRDDFHEIADRLRQELRDYGKIDSDRKWDETQVKFLTAHRYFTQTAIRTRQEKKMKNLEEIKQRLLRNDYKD